MKIDVVTHPKNPLDLPKVRARIAIFLTSKDCIACMRVSRDWFEDFVQPVWHTIDFAKDTKFVGLDRYTLEKYGHCIRRVVNILTFEHVRALQHPTLNRVQAMSLGNQSKPYHRSIQFDFIRRCSTTLTELEFCGLSDRAETTKDQLRKSEFYLETSMLMSYTPSATPVSRLESLTLSRVCLSYEGFVTLLRNSPNLRKLSLFRVAVVHYSEAFGLYQESRVTSLHASLAEVAMPHPGDGWTPSLLHLFPRLESWHFTAVDRSKNWGQDLDFRQELTRCTPLLKTLRFDPVADTVELSDLLVNCIRLPQSCTFSAENLDVSLLLSLTTHYDTLTSITITDKCTDAEEMRWVYLIPKMCLNLKVLSMEELTLEMELVEEHQWRCQDLQELRVRFKGLEDLKAIDECLISVCSHRRRPSSRVTSESISSQVSQHLLQFCKLKTVWLGSKVYYLPVPSAPAAAIGEYSFLKEASFFDKTSSAR
ncbi:hypothetical protein BGW39_003837 [Mortierella sp. 14UC]|nr:hypothetical protein BGW39_003837 [Mortierella sp. 14UC]